MGRDKGAVKGINYMKTHKLPLEDKAANSAINTH
jgi:hypothetical protein